MPQYGGWQMCKTCNVQERDKLWMLRRIHIFLFMKQDCGLYIAFLVDLLGYSEGKDRYYFRD